MTTQHTLSFSSQTPTHFSTNWCYSWHRWSFSHLRWSKTTHHCQQLARLIYTLAALWAGKSELVTLFSSQVGRQQKAIQHSKDKKHPLNMIRNPPTCCCMGRRAEQLWPGLYQETTNNTFFKLRMCHIVHMCVWWHNTESLVQHPLSVCLCLVIKNPLTSDSSLYNGCLCSTTVISVTSITSVKYSLNEASLVPVLCQISEYFLWPLPCTSCKLNFLLIVVHSEQRRQEKKVLHTWWLMSPFVHFLNYHSCKDRAFQVNHRWKKWGSAPAIEGWACGDSQTG